MPAEIAYGGNDDFRTLRRREAREANQEHAVRDLALIEHQGAEVTITGDKKGIPRMTHKNLTPPRAAVDHTVTTRR